MARRPWGAVPLDAIRRTFSEGLDITFGDKRAMPTPGASYLEVK